MIFEQITQYRMESAEGYMISRSKHGDGFIYVARAPRIVGYLYCGGVLSAAEAACVEHLQRNELVEVHVAALCGPALNWAIANALGLNVLAGTDLDGEPVCMLANLGGVFDPSGDWEQGGPVLDRFGVINTDLAAACRAVVGMFGGNVMKVPAVLLGGG